MSGVRSHMNALAFYEMQRLSAPIKSRFEQLQIAALRNKILTLPHVAVVRDPAPGAQPGECHYNADKFVKDHTGYTLVRGWSFYGDGWFLHSLVRTPRGDYVCPTPADASGPDEGNTLIFAQDTDIISVAPVGYVLANGYGIPVPTFIPNE
jgi:hypothetical protein